MLSKFVCCFALALVLVLVAAGPKRADDYSEEATSANGERLAALYIKDTDENGELRFLTGLGALGGSNTNLNAVITQKQNLLEALRPTNANGNGVATPIIVNLANLGTGISPTASAPIGTATAPIGTATAIAGTGGAATGNGQVIVGGNRRVVNRRRVNNRRRGVNNRRRGTNNRRRRPVYVIRPAQ